MSKSKKQFLKLQDKLKRLYFKKAIQLVNPSIKLNLAYNFEKYNIPQLNSEKIALEKESKKLYKTNVVNKSSSISLFSKNHSEYRKHNLISKNKNKNLENKIKLIKNNHSVVPNFEFSGKQKENTTQRNYNLSSKTNKIKKIDYFKNNKVNFGAFLPDIVVKNEPKHKQNTIKPDIVVKNEPKYKQNTIKLEYIDNADKLKNIKVENSNNLNKEIDAKDAFIPSKQQLYTIKRLVNYKKLEKPKIIRANKIESVRKNLTSSNTVLKDNKVYVLPAFQRGTNGPLEQDVVGKIHKGETILTSKETKQYLKPKQIVKDEKPINLAYLKNLKPEMVASDTTSKVAVNIKDPNPKPKILDEVEKVRTPTPKEIVEEINNIANSAVTFNKLSQVIKNNLAEPSLYYKDEIKNKMSPVWRTSLG